MYIISAIFGTDHCKTENNSCYYDVTSRIKQDVNEATNSLTQIYTWRELGDPCRGVHKTLIITYCQNNQIFVVHIPETAAGIVVAI